MAEAAKVLVVVDFMTQETRVYSNLPNLMVEVEPLGLEDPDDERDLELLKREYPYLQFGEEPDNEE